MHAVGGEWTTSTHPRSLKKTYSLKPCFNMSPAYDGLMTSEYGGSSCQSTPSASTAALTPYSNIQEDNDTPTNDNDYNDGQVVVNEKVRVDDDRCEEKRELLQSSGSVLLYNSCSSTSTLSSSHTGPPAQKVKSYTGTIDNDNDEEQRQETKHEEDQLESTVCKASPEPSTSDACSNHPFKKDIECLIKDEVHGTASMEERDSGVDFAQDTSMKKNTLHQNNYFSYTKSSFSPPHLEPTITSAPLEEEEQLETKNTEDHESCNKCSPTTTTSKADDDDRSPLNSTTLITSAPQLEEEPETEPTTISSTMAEHTCTSTPSSSPSHQGCLVELPIEKSATSFTPRGVLTSASTSGDDICADFETTKKRKPKKQVTFLSRPKPNVKLSPNTSPRSPRLSLGTTPSYSSKHTRTRSPLPRLDEGGDKKDEDEDGPPSSREELMRKPLTIPLRPHAAFPISISIVSDETPRSWSPVKNRERLISQDSSSNDEKGRSVPFKKPKDFPEGEEFTIGPRIAQIETKLLSLDEKTLKQFDVVNSRGRKTKRSSTAPAAAGTKLEDDWWGTSSAPSDHNGSDSEVMCEFFAIGTPTGSRARASSVCSLGSLYSTRSSKSSRSMKSMRSLVSTGSIYKDSSAGSIYSDEGSLYGDE